MASEDLLLDGAQVKRVRDLLIVLAVPDGKNRKIARLDPSKHFTASLFTLSVLEFLGPPRGKLGHEQYGVSPILPKKKSKFILTKSDCYQW